MSMKSESDGSTMLKDCSNLPAVEDEGDNGNVEADGPLKKGPWTSAEDSILVAYVTKHGEGNWNAVHKRTGLARCGKSCRLRWANHLRPDLKKVPISQEEEELIVKLHAKMGNKWARMAVELPGRTDNEIKNFWNTRLKRKERAGLPIYPPEICTEASNENQLGDNSSALPSVSAHYPDFFPLNNIQIPPIEFKNFDVHQKLYSQAILDTPPSCLLDIPSSSLLSQGLSPSFPNKSLPPTVHPPKLLRVSKSSFPSLNAGMGNAIPCGSTCQDDVSVQNAQPPLMYSSYDNCSAPTSYDHIGSHAVLNGDPSSSEPSWATKTELPSLQTQGGYWASPPSPLPSLESPTQNNLASNLSPNGSSLLDAVLYGSQTVVNSMNSSVQQNWNDADVIDASSQDPYETNSETYGQTSSPFGCPSSSIFNEGMLTSGVSFDELNIQGDYQDMKF